MDKRFVAFLVVIFVGFGGFILWNNSNKDKTVVSEKPTAHYAGKLDSKVTLTEYGDFECSVCEGYFPTTQAVQEKYKDTVRFQFRQLPLAQVHQNAMGAARAAEAAGFQGKFWEMHDLLYNASNYAQWTASKDATTFFKQYAQQLNLNAAQFSTDFASEKVNNIIAADRAEFEKTGESMATPTFFLNGKKVDNSSLLDSNSYPSVDAFSKVLDNALK